MNSKYFHKYFKEKKKQRISCVVFFFKLGNYSPRDKARENWGTVNNYLQLNISLLLEEALKINNPTPSAYDEAETPKDKIYQNHRPLWPPRPMLDWLFKMVMAGTPKNLKEALFFTTERTWAKQWSRVTGPHPGLVAVSPPTPYCVLGESPPKFGWGLVTGNSSFHTLLFFLKRQEWEQHHTCTFADVSDV